MGKKDGDVKMEFELSDKNGKMCDFHLTYFEIPPPVSGDVLNKCQSFLAMVQNTEGQAKTKNKEGREYKVTFKYHETRAGGVSGGGGQQTATANGLNYEQACDMERTGAKMIVDLLELGQAMLQSGQRV